MRPDSTSATPVHAMVFRCLLAVGLLVLGCVTTPSSAEVAQRPLLASASSAPPNVMFTLDDSGSMFFECLPDANCTASTYYIGTVPVETGTTYKEAVAAYDSYTVTTTSCTSYYWWGGCASSSTSTSTVTSNSLFGRQMRTAPPVTSTSRVMNPLYYDPSVLYLPWLKADGTRYPNSVGTAAAINPEDGSSSATIDLTTPQTINTRWCTSQTSCTTEARGVVIAQYYRLTSGTGTALGDFTQTVISSATSSYPKATTRTDCAASTCTYAEELQNFANWFSYARNRARVAIGGTAEAFASVPANYRVGYGRINKGSTTIDGTATETIERGVRPFTGTDRTAFYTWLFARTSPTGGTPLRRAMDDVGQYFSRSSNSGPWGAVPGTNDTTAHAICRRAFHVMMTDGGWNGDAANTSGATGNVDNSNGSTITGPNGQSYRYTPARPYSDSNSGTLADVAMYYWSRDLRTDLDNGVTANSLNPAFWQHMVNHTISFGIDGSLDNPGDLLALTNGTKNWPNPTSDGPKIDDLWHASVNSRGTSSSARTSTEYAAALQSVFIDIAAASGSEAGVEVSTRGLTGATRKYVPTYDSARWSGDVAAVSVPADGSDGTLIWRATSNLPAAASRNIFTYNAAATGTKGVAFAWANLSDAMKTSLYGATTGGEALVNYLRGDRTGETSTYRARSSPLGDIVNSTPVLVKDLYDGQYDFLPSSVAGRSTYRRFVRAKSFRQAQLFVGANDGMLHAFSDSNGAETFAFMPGAVLGRVKDLASTSYSHRYFVDGPLAEADIYDSSAAKWRNLVAGSGGAGTKNLFAINVPVPVYPTTGDPTALTVSESAPSATDILWEIDTSTTGFSELGYVLQTPEFGITRDGTWVMVVGNGYESASGKAQLFIINALTGALVKRIDTGVGSTSDLNGLGGVRVVLDSYQRIVSVYGGDLKGNVWKFDLSSSTSTNWDVAFGGTAGTARNPLFIARNAAGVVEPITAAPTYALHPLGGVQVLVGSGKLFETADPSVNDQRALYGVWDTIPVGSDSSSATSRVTDNTLLVGQTVTSTALTGTTGGVYYSVTSNSVDYGTKRGWRLPLTIATGQRLIYDPQVTTGRVFFETMVPTGGVASCTSSSIARYGFVLDPFLGGPGATGPTFDTNGDGSFTSTDNATAGAFELGTGGRSGVISVGDGRFGIVTPEGGLRNVQGARTDARRYWRQIINPPL